ncbi:FtsK/SpoIIIE domain-containing protein [Saccharomonospora halophila]|uniref:hypothetical protein n=1 Tax=Saccharomonospora halophila TaxID=129922 RepID=UPI0003702AC7|nr:hypothetical protein [Saccharomonospora halophila]
MTTEQHGTDQGEELARVHYLPAQRQDTDEATSTPGEVIEGELVTDAEYARLTSEKAKALARYEGYKHDLVTAGHITRRVATHERTKTATRTAVRHVLYVPAGAASFARRAWESRTTSRYERQMRAAETAGDLDRLQEWESRAEMFKERRHKRVMDWIGAPFQLVKALAVAAVSVMGLLLALGVVLAVADSDAGLVLAPIGGFLDLVQWSAWAVTVVWGPLMLAAPWVVVLVLWNEGRRRASVPNWLAAGTATREDVVIDERSIAHALSHLGLSPLTKFFKDGGVLQYTKVPARDGVGVSCQLRLPAGVAASDIIENKDRRKRLAGAFQRAMIEVWPSTGADEGLLDLWVADSGALEVPTAPWPWLEQRDPVDFYEGVPVGVDLRGDAVIAPTDGASYLVGGRPGQGKSSFTRLLALGACLDPNAELWVRVLADNADFEDMAPRLSRYSAGMGDDVAAAALQDLYDLRAEMERRGKVMKAKRAGSARDAGLHPILAIFDEVHRGFQHRELGKEMAFIGEDVIKQARKYGIIVVFATQSPTATSIPKGVTREVICRVAFSVIDQVGNDALLGDGNYKRGVRATELRPGSPEYAGDRGTCLTVGVVPGKDWSMVRSHFVSLDQAAEVAEHALALLHGRNVPSTETDTDDGPDPLADIATVLGDKPRLRTQEVLQGLTELNRGTYGRWTFTDLTAYLAEHGAEPYKSDGKKVVSAEAIRDALTKRDRPGSGPAGEHQGDD